VMGGPMMGFTLNSLDAPVIKTSNCLLAATLDELPPPPPAMPCIRCGDCAEVCPANLLPQQLHFYALGDDYDQLQAHNLFDCIECGACAYVCPSSIPLVQYYRSAKAEMREQAKNLEKAEHAKQRFEFRQERLRLEEERKEAARKERAERLARSRAKQAEKAEQNAAAGQTTAESNEDEVKRLRIASSMANVALRKAQKQLDAHGTDELKAQVEQLKANAEKAQQALAAVMPAKKPAAADAKKPAKPEPSATEQALNRAKITAAMKRAELRKAQRAEADADTLATLQAELAAAEEHLAQLNQTEDVGV